MVAMSPAAKTSGSVTVCSVSVTSIKPSASSARPVFLSQLAPPARVTQMTSSAKWCSPLMVVKPTASTAVTAALTCRATPRDSSVRVKRCCTERLWVGKMLAPRVNKLNFSSSGSWPRVLNSWRRRCCMASSNSTPPAPPPTKAMCIGPGRV